MAMMSPQIDLCRQVDQSSRAGLVAGCRRRREAIENALYVGIDHNDFPPINLWRPRREPRIQLVDRQGGDVHRRELRADPVDRCELHHERARTAAWLMLRGALTLEQATNSGRAQMEPRGRWYLPHIVHSPDRQRRPLDVTRRAGPRGARSRTLLE